jgi:dienelactone hydrolase
MMEGGRSRPEDIGLQLSTSGALRYLLGQPGRPAAAGGHPVLCFLHGLDEGAPLEITRALTRHGPLSPVTPVKVASEFILVAPQMPQRGDLWHRHAGEVRAVVEAVADEHGGDRSRIFLTGFSFGANGVWDVALDQPGFWSALWAVDPTRAPSRDPRVPVWLSAGELSRRLRDEFIRRLRLEVPADHVPGERVYIDEGLDHVRTATSAYGDDRIYRWLLSRCGPESVQGSSDPKPSASGESPMEKRAENHDRV